MYCLELLGGKILKSILTNSINLNSILIASLPSYGNIGQMTLDCIISTLANQNKIERIGNCFSSCLYPMTGYEDFSSNWKNILCLPIEGFILFYLFL